MIEFNENLTAANRRIKADIENMHNLAMKIQMDHVTSDKLELLRELEQRLWKTHAYCVETIRTYQT